MSDGVLVNIEDLWGHIKTQNDRISILEHRYGNVSSAFVKNDLDKPDFDGHRRAHLAQIKQAEVMDGLKQDGAKGIIKGILGFIGGILTLGIIEFFRNGGGK